MGKLIVCICSNKMQNKVTHSPYVIILAGSSSGYFSGLEQMSLKSSAPLPNQFNIPPNFCIRNTFRNLEVTKRR